MIPSPLDLVIFDCDGVLIDSEPIANRVHAAALTALGYAISAEDLIRRFTGMTDREMYELIEQDRGRPLPASYAAEVGAAMKAAYAGELRPMAGIEAVLAVITPRRCVASSSDPDKLRLGLEHAGLCRHFAPHVFSAASVARGKPAPDLFLYAATQMNAAPPACLVIEDSVAGVRAARAAGMAVLGFCGGGHCTADHGARLLDEGAIRVFSAMTELPAALAGA